jgi:integrase
MRKGEVRALRWADIRSLGDGRTLAMIRTSKDGRPRVVHCTRTMVEVLKRQEGRKLAGDDRVFPISPMTLRRRWEQARKAAGLGDVTLHDLRRTHGTHAAAAGVDLRTLADRIGHADLTMLQKHYAAVVGTAAEEAAKIFQTRFDTMVVGS